MTKWEESLQSSAFSVRYSPFVFYGLTAMLEVCDLQVHYQGIEALKGVSFRVAPRKVVTLIGANGAGKSSLLRTISGLVPCRAGRIVLQQEDITHLPAHLVARKGISLIPEGRKVFVNLTVSENLVMGAYHRHRDLAYRRDLDWVVTVFPRLQERLKQKAGTLSGGEQQMLAVGRAVMASPRLLMMDEPSLGLAPILVEEIFQIIERIRARGTTILLIEQNAWGALESADYGYVLENGQIVLEGPAKELIRDDRVRQAYLGEG
jgi:branched-chain amino acid transport system ATP-binding protein